MRFFHNRFIRVLATITLVFSAALILGLLINSSDSNLKPWHTERLNEEFTVEKANNQVRSLENYLELEQRLFNQLDKKVYAKSETGPDHALERYSPGSMADPRNRNPNWNRSFELPANNPVGGVLLLHGMSDSPYSMRSLGIALNKHGYRVVALRLPGHGTAPSGLRHVKWQDMAAAVSLGMEHLSSKLGSKPVHIIGYSTGAPLALNFALNSIEKKDMAVPASLVLISPAIRVHPTGALAGMKDLLSILPGLDGMAYLALMNEFDPYKYNSFATNAAAQVHAITRSVDRRISALAESPAAVKKLPPILVFKSTVDSTVTTDAVVDNLLMRLPENQNELVLFDINRNTIIKSTLLVSDPGPLTSRMMADSTLPFAVSFITNENEHSRNVIVRHKKPFSLEVSNREQLGISWPAGVVSLSHVALPIPPDDPLYGQQPPEDSSDIFLGNLAFTGERGLLKIPEDWLLRQRYNPFYSFLEKRLLEWVDESIR